ECRAVDCPTTCCGIRERSSRAGVSRQPLDYAARLSRFRRVPLSFESLRTPLAEGKGTVMSRLREVPNSVQFAELELGVLARWQRERTFEQSLEQRRDAPPFVFYDGPPFATGLPHYGHIMTSFIKDVVPRYQTMRGRRVPRRWGWDCHGLPVELEVERELGLASPSDIARHGVARFNDACRSLVMRYASEWETVMARIGRWVDFAGAYRTMDDSYVESVVWCFKELHERGLVYEGQKVVPYCTRCQTALSNFETRLDDAYRARDDLS